MEDAPAVHIIDHPSVNALSDLYEGVRFMHRKHANVLKDCTLCHHRIPREEGDTYGMPATLQLLREKEIVPSGCAVCHGTPFNEKQLHTPGLKGAFHQLCMDCHQESEQVPHARGPVIHSAMVRGPIARTLDTRAPTDCLACHPRRVPDHKELVKLKESPDALSVTQNCLSCHAKEGEAILKTSHWNWQGPSPFTVGHEKRIDLGKRHTTINNFCINLNGNWERCTSCHIGYGWKDKDFDFADKSRIDCLVCHDTTKTYKKAPAGAGFPADGVDLLKVAQNVGRPDRSTCGTSCHFVGGGGDAVKHGDMNTNLEKPGGTCDVHMGTDGKGMNFKCQDCHKTRNHMISGRSIAVPAAEGDLSCQYCHTDDPHPEGSLLSQHLNRHTETVSCQTCHIPIYSKCRPTKVSWDWSTAGDDRTPEKDKYGKPVYDKMKGSFVWKESAKPDYYWYNGTVKRHLLGDRIEEEGTTELARPVGSIRDPASRIYPFKLHRGKQISDAVSKRLIVPKLWNGYWKHWDWNRAAKDGMAAAGLEYSGKYEFVETVMYWGITHEVMPKENALSCANCHIPLSKAPYCGTCHQEKEGLDFKNLSEKGIDFEALSRQGRDVRHLKNATDYIDFKALGYPGDPIATGGRFSRLPLAKVEADLPRTKTR
ncbi:MAG: tetrathionate reductase family octaheme c-type cytochrome [Desulfobacteraceae bacterium]|nr:MAG: tetrathionate reductase family octaheme c-type cytochrome [Desulfobacteraceae bacterium]